MMKKLFFFLSILSCSLCFTSSVHAKYVPDIESAVMTTYPPAAASKALKSAHYELNPNILRGFVVVMKGGIPAERARFFVEWQEYDYRGVVIHLDKKDKMTTRTGHVYTYLQRGDVLAVAGIKIFNKTVYLDLITPEVCIPPDTITKKRHSRVTVMLGFKFPKKVFKTDDGQEVIRRMEEWLKSFKGLDEAKAYGAGLKGAEARTVVETEEAVRVEEAAKVKAKAEGKPVDEKEVKMQVLENKIESARKQMDEAQKEMKDLKREMRKKN